MSNATATRSSARAARSLSGLTFGGLLNSEWIKLRTLRSTFWCYLIIVVTTIGLGLVVSMNVSTDSSGAALQDAWVTTALPGVGFGQLVIAVLGALIITGEYGTGMIRSTLAAVPQRLPALFAKMVVFGLITFVVSFASIAVGALISLPILAGKSLTPDVGDGKAWLAFLGGAGYLTLIGVMALGIGAILRNSAAGIATALGLILVVPNLLMLLSLLTNTKWPVNVFQFLPSSAGSIIYAYPTGVTSGIKNGLITLDSTQGLLVLIGWVVLAFVVASLLLKRRDV